MILLLIPLRPYFYIHYLNGTFSSGMKGSDKTWGR